MNLNASKCEGNYQIYSYLRKDRNDNKIFIFILYSHIANMTLGCVRHMGIGWEWRWIIIDIERDEF